eukprot:CAMPEP_0177711928 /NCGR_PEP_ID=MMETSP0484_2-20121128/12126_1 /TAXON_ID=354590 /ORGANISM="Rhodomonas lens, Strain RHODO" /LENGTH=147 /DNA_ID=CAMNT_0019223701 /DNA_START=101 /DNA_END=544 /DNA_ORIENTATION=-
MMRCFLLLAFVLSLAEALSTPQIPNVLCTKRLPAVKSPGLRECSAETVEILRLRGAGESEESEEESEEGPPGFDTLERLGRVKGIKPYKKKSHENVLLKRVGQVLVFGWGVGCFALICATAHVGFSMAAGPKRTSPPPVRTTTGLPY